MSTKSIIIFKRRDINGFENSYSIDRSTNNTFIRTWERTGTLCILERNRTINLNSFNSSHIKGNFNTFGGSEITVSINIICLIRRTGSSGLQLYHNLVNNILVITGYIKRGEVTNLLSKTDFILGSCCRSCIQTDRIGNITSTTEVISSSIDALINIT